MKWSLKLGQIAGIGIFVHWTFVILLVWIVYAHISQGKSAALAARGVAFVLAIFACIVLHELGHALTARRYGIRTRDITLLPIGGLARLERMPDDPTQELWVALAGPAVNVIIAFVLSIVLVLLRGVQGFTQLAFIGGDFLAGLVFVNVVLVLFNLLPAFPMDGGRVLRALLARNMDYVRATQLASSVGQGMAILFGIWGLLLGHPILLFIALFVYLGAQQEAHMAQARALLGGVPVHDAMVTRFRVLEVTDSLATVVAELLQGEQQDFPVVEAGRVVGVLTRSDVIVALAQGDRDALVSDVMRRECQVVDESEMLQETFLRMQQQQCATLPVVRNDELVGLLTLENVGEWMMIQSAFRKAKARRHVENVFRPT